MCNNKILIKSRRGQVPDTMVWFVATFVIILVLIMAIYATSVFGNLKFAGNMFIRGDRLIEKSIFAFLLTPMNSGKILFQELLEGSESDSLSEQAGQELFNELYGKKYTVSFYVKNDGFDKSTAFNIFGTGIEYFTRGIEIVGNKGVEVTLKDLI